VGEGLGVGWDLSNGLKEVLGPAHGGPKIAKVDDLERAFARSYPAIDADRAIGSSGDRAIGCPEALPPGYRS
jgi:hypothetical protein